MKVNEWLASRMFLIWSRVGWFIRGVSIARMNLRPFGHCVSATDLKVTAEAEFLPVSYLWV